MIMNMNKKEKVRYRILFIFGFTRKHLSLSYIEIIDSDKNMAKKEFTI